MTATPEITAAIAIQVARGTRSRNSTTPISAAIRGTPACSNSTLATVVYASATTKEVDAVAKQSATPTPARPMARNRRQVPRRPCCQSMNASKKLLANTERQNTVVQLSVTLRKRAIAPPKLHTVAEPKTSQAPRTSKGLDSTAYSAPRR